MNKTCAHPMKARTSAACRNCPLRKAGPVPSRQAKTQEKEKPSEPPPPRQPGRPGKRILVKQYRKLPNGSTGVRIRMVTVGQDDR